jgi:hypothetical protein
MVLEIVIGPKDVNMMVYKNIKIVQMQLNLLVDKQLAYRSPFVS